MTQSQPRGLYFEEFEIGQKFYSSSRTITEGDIVTFAGCLGIIIKSIPMPNLARTRLLASGLRMDYW